MRKPDGKRSFERPMHYKWEDNIKLDLQEEVWGDMDWIELSQDRGR